MQTFITNHNYMTTAKTLDYKRLGKQRVEAWQIYKALSGQSKGWVNHPAVRMWTGYEFSLTVYGICMCVEWQQRGYRDQMLDRFVNLAKVLPDTGRPAFTDDERVILSHRSNLIRKFPEFYGPLFPGVPDDLPYYWPEPATTKGA